MQEFNLPKAYNWELASKATPVIYKAQIIQSTTAAPTALVYENTLKTDIIWTRTSAGVYMGTLEAGSFDPAITFVLISCGLDGSHLIAQAFVNHIPNAITVTFVDPAGVATDLHGNAFIEVQVYNQ